MLKRKRAASALPQDLHIRDRWFMIAKALLAVSPLLSLGFLRLASMNVGNDLQQTLSGNPALTVSFLASMSGPFIAWLLGFAQKHLYDGDSGYMVLNLSLMMAAEAMLSNAFFCGMMAVLLYLMCDLTGVTPWQALRRKWSGGLLRDISGGLVLLIFSAFCMFVSQRLGM